MGKWVYLEQKQSLRTCTVGTPITGASCCSLLVQNKHVGDQGEKT